MKTIVASIIAFATTNIDDIFILTLFFSNSTFKTTEIVIGQYLGISALITVSFLASFIGLIIDVKYIGLLGLIPIYLGIKSAISLFAHSGQEDERNSIIGLDNSKSNAQHFFSVAAVTFANGGDNISIYTPLFSALTISGKLVMTFIFLIMTSLWCLTAQYLSKRPLIQKAAKKYGHIITPFIFVLLGLYIMYESKTFAFLLKN